MFVVVVVIVVVVLVVGLPITQDHSWLRMGRPPVYPLLAYS